MKIRGPTSFCRMPISKLIPPVPEPSFPSVVEGLSGGQMLKSLPVAILLGCHAQFWTQDLKGSTKLVRGVNHPFWCT